MIEKECYQLNNGIEIPKIGFGTWQIPDGKDAYESVLFALKCGYRHIDTAYVYGNEQSVGQAIIDSGIPRKDIFITTKLPADVKNYDAVFEYFSKSLSNLKTDYIDLYLIHAPWPWKEVGKDCTAGNIDAWKAMIEIYKSGKIKAIGVSNFHPQDIEAIVKTTGVWPSVNQIRYFIGNTQPLISEYCEKNSILIEAYSPLATGELLENELLQSMAKSYHKTVAQICLRYCLEKNTLPIPKSTHPQRIEANIDLDFEMTKEDVMKLDQLYHIVSTRPLRD